MKLTTNQHLALNVLGRAIVGGCAGLYVGQTATLLCKTICKNPVSKLAIGIGSVAISAVIGNQIDELFNKELELYEENNDIYEEDFETE